MVFDLFGPNKKAIIAMAHVGAPPGTPLHDIGGGMQKLIDDVIEDVDALQAGGVDAVMFGNEWLASPASTTAPPTSTIGDDHRRPGTFRRPRG